MADREDDLKLGVKSMAILFGEMDRTILAGLQLTFIAGLVLIGQTVQMGPWYYGGLLAVFFFDLRQQYLIRNRVREKCVHAFLNNAWLGGAVFLGIVLDYLYR